MADTSLDGSLSSEQKKADAERANMRGYAQLMLTGLNRVQENPNAPWINVGGNPPSRLDVSGNFGKAKDLNPFTRLTMTLYADLHGYESSTYTDFKSAQAADIQVKKGEKSFPVLSYTYPTYVNRTNPQDRISAEDYWKKLSAEEKKEYKGERVRYFRPMFNLEQTTIMDKPEALADLRQNFGSRNQRGNVEKEERAAKRSFKGVLAGLSANLAPIAKVTEVPRGTAVAKFVPGGMGGKDAILVPPAKNYASHAEYMQDVMRQAVAATGSSQFLDRKGLVMPGGNAPGFGALAYERLVQELGSAYKMTEMGLPARISPENVPYLEMWREELESNPKMIDALETDVNKALFLVSEAEKGRTLEPAMIQNMRRTQDLYAQASQRHTSVESAVLVDWLANKGMFLDPRNFPDEKTKTEFEQKFSATGLLPQISSQLELAKDPEMAEQAYTEAENIADRVQDVIRADLEYGWEREGKHIAADYLAGLPSAKNRDIVVVADPATGIHDVILPGGASRGGAVYTGGQRKPFLMTPDEVMTRQERKDANARIEYSNPRGMAKSRIATDLYKQGASYVRFFNSDGVMAYRPGDAYFQGKTATVAKVTAAGVNMGTKIPLEPFIRGDRAPKMNALSVFKHHDGSYAMFMRPVGEKGFAVSMSREDQNRYWTTVKQKRSEDITAIKEELSAKYYNEARRDPSKRIESEVLFPAPAATADLSRIQDVKFWESRGKTYKDNKYWCAPVIEGAGKVEPREITKTQMEMRWLAPDRDAYMASVTSHVFQDILSKDTERVKGVDEAVREEKTEQRDNRAHADYHEEADRGQQKREQEHEDYHEEIDKEVELENKSASRGR